MNNGLKGFLAFLKQTVAKQTGREQDREKFIRHIRETALQSGKPPVENQMEEHLENGDETVK